MSSDSGSSASAPRATSDRKYALWTHIKKETTQGNVPRAVKLLSSRIFKQTQYHKKLGILQQPGVLAHDSHWGPIIAGWAQEFEEIDADAPKAPEPPPTFQAEI